MPHQYTHCLQLRNIPINKMQIYKGEIIASCEICSKAGIVICDKCALKNKLLDRYIDANIPIDFWRKSRNDFYGDPNLIKLYDEITNDVDEFFKSGKSLFLKGMHGVGKTLFASLVLKKIVEKGFSGLYSTLSDIVATIVGADYKARFEAGRELKMVDFLIIDEFDPRFFGNDNSAELFGRILEALIRIRFQNYMPTILITNNMANINRALGDALGASIDSLLSGYCREVFITGADYRKTPAMQNRTL